MLAALQELRARLGVLENQCPEKEKIAFSQIPEGLPRGILVEITGKGKRESIAALLAENPDLYCAWIESKLSILPSALEQRKINLEKLFFVEGGNETSWAAATVLRSQIFPIVVYNAPHGDLRELRRFQLLASKAQSTMLLLAEDPTPNAWPIRLSLCVQAEGRKVSIARR